MLGTLLRTKQTPVNQVATNKQSNEGMNRTWETHTLQGATKPGFVANERQGLDISAVCHEMGRQKSTQSTERSRRKWDSLGGWALLPPGLWFLGSLDSPAHGTGSMNSLLIRLRNISTDTLA